MDKFIVRFDAEKNRDLKLCRHRGVAYQRRMQHRVSYDAAYFDKCRSYEDQKIAVKINAGRIALVNQYVGDTKVVDIGVGSGEFLRKRGNTLGHDINPSAVDWLKETNCWAGEETLSTFTAFTFWDVLEHVEDPDHYFRHVGNDSYLFTSLPIFTDLDRIRESKHYRPGEHLYYWTEQGFIDWMALYRFRLLERQDFEIKAGRDSILSFAFKRDLPSYHDTLKQYRILHEPIYGASAWLYLDLIAPHVLEHNPKSILDYGCGRSDLAAHFWKDGKRHIARYDPAIPQYEVMPDGEFNLVVCCDVMEHILMQDVDRILREIRSKSPSVIFVISLKPARAKLPDGRNAHVTLLSDTEWTRWIDSIFPRSTRIPTQWDHVLMLKTFG